MRRPSAEIFLETIEAQRVIIERLRDDNKKLVAAAETLMDQIERLEEERANLRILAGELLGTNEEEL